MLVSVKPLRLIVVIPLVTDEKGALNGAAVGILEATVEEGLVDVDGSIGDGVVESEDDHLGGFFRAETAGNMNSIATAEAIGQTASTGLTRFGVSDLT